MTGTPLSARTFMLLVPAVRLVFTCLKVILKTRRQKKPLPREVADIYDADRYRVFLAREGEIRRLRLIFRGISFAIDAALLLSPIFGVIESLAGGNAYLTALLTYGVYWLVGEAVDLPGEYLITFAVDEKYGLNKMTKREFAKDELLSMPGEIFTGLGLLLALAFCGEHMSRWTRGFTLGWGKTALIGLGAGAALLAVSMAASLVEFFLWKKKYTFTPLPEGELREKIRGLMAGCRKKVSRISVYDESKKSTEKNAFLLKLFRYREFGIADNFLNGNDEGELLAVLSHEIGHLKHKRDLLDLAGRVIGIAAAALLLALLCRPAPALAVNRWVRESFQIGSNNYYVLISVYGGFLSPVLFLMNLFSNWRSRRNELQADMEAVKNGLGEELISTFSKITADELIDLNPHPLLEWLDYDHPGMYRRISYIREAACTTAPGAALR